MSKPVKYDADHHTEVTKGFDRIAYLLELQKGTGPGQFVFVSMDAFTDDINKVGIPDASNGARFQQKVTSMNVISNVETLATGTALDGGNIEFWASNYGPGNAANVPGASGSAFDFGDQMTEPADGYGCMQVHNHKAAQTIFAINHWSQGGKGAELGIGNSPAGNPDYTFTKNAGSYSFKRLRVLVRPKG
jgi:sialate O-acetylesterase